jgi:hypothetical protein
VSPSASTDSTVRSDKGNVSNTPLYTFINLTPEPRRRASSGSVTSSSTPSGAVTRISEPSTSVGSTKRGT